VEYQKKRGIIIKEPKFNIVRRLELIDFRGTREISPATLPLFDGSDFFRGSATIFILPSQNKKFYVNLSQ